MLVAHWTSDAPFRLRPIEIRNAECPSMFSKPCGALWTSPVAAKDGWAEWCRAESFRDTDADLRVILEVDESRLLVIDGPADAAKLPVRTHAPAGYQMTYFDWEIVAGRYGGVWLTNSGLWSTRFRYFPSERGASLYGWDCQTVCIFKESVIRRVHQPAVWTHPTVTANTNFSEKENANE